MQGRLIIGMAIVSVLAPANAMAAEVGRRQGCRVENPQPQRQKQVQGQQEQQQQRARVQDCREKRAIPPVVDPTPIFLL